ncbi:MAG: diaminopimelate epimerase [Longimicrobiales bacterium]
MRDPSGVPIAKGQALGNDYLVADAAELPAPPARDQVRSICDRHRGIGADGILIGDVARRPFRLTIYNPDGSEAEKSGNGLRIFGAWLHRRGLVRSELFRVRLTTDEVEIRVHGELDGGALDIAVAMGVAVLGAGAGAGAGERPTATPLDLGDGRSAEVYPVSLGNPHCVVLVPELDRADFRARAPRLCTHPFFPAGTNVQFARVLDADTIEAWIWERGVGETLASGSSSCAIAAVTRALGLTGAAVTVRMPGGSVSVRFDETGMAHLRGPAQIVFTGAVPRAVWEAWGGA